MSDGYQRLEALAALNARLAEREPTMLVALGDSNTCNTGFTAGAKQWPELLHDELKKHHRHQRIMMFNAGVSGDKVTDLLARFDSDVARVQPQGCILCIGSNDKGRLTPEAFRSGLHELLDRLAAIDCEVLVRTPTPILEYLDDAPDRLWPDGQALRDFCDIIRGVAAERGLALVDTYRMWRAAETAGDLVPGELYRDAVHTNAAGHARVAAELHPAFGIAPADSDAMAADGSYRRRAASPNPGGFSCQRSTAPSGGDGAV